MTIYEFFSLMGGVGLFLYGMSIMSSGLKSAAGVKFIAGKINLLMSLYN